MRTTNFMKHEFQCHQSKVLQSVSIFLMQTVYWFDPNLKFLDFKITQKVNKQKISCKNLGFVLVVCMS